MDFILNTENSSGNLIEPTKFNAASTSEFARDVICGLSKTPKSLPSKYFYDATGSRLFQQIMDLPEYYITRTEFKILEEQQAGIARFFDQSSYFDLVELGAGDGLKTKILLRQLLKSKTNFEYIPVDISGDVLNQLQASLKSEMPELKVDKFTGDYFRALNWLQKNKPSRKVVLFLGSNIGNFESEESEDFIKQIASYLHPGDKLLMGFDLLKDPHIIRPAYDDAKGVTAAFNMNLLKRMNHELQANFDLEQFEHFAEYDPQHGMMHSFLISKKKQMVTFGALNHTVSFEAWEPILTENSHKYSLEQIEALGKQAGLSIEQVFTDDQKLFADVLYSYQ